MYALTETGKQQYSLLDEKLKCLMLELKTEIPGAQTWRIDRTSSAHATELREPFLDYNLVEYSASIPANYKINFNGEIQKKFILQKLAKKFLPDAIAKRKKFPWGIPYYDFFINEFLPLAECLIDKGIKNHRPFLNSNSNQIKDLEGALIAMSPEGTRSKVKEWKTGFLRIAKELNTKILKVLEKTLKFLEER